MAVLRLIQDAKGQRREVYRLEGVTILGRTAPSQVILPSPSVSREHARISASGDGYVIEDMDSVNGTFLNGERIQSASLHNGDVIRIHDFVLEFEHRKQTEPDNMRTIVSSTSGATGTLVATRSYENLFDLTSAKDAVETLRRRLKVIYEVSRAATGNFSVEALFAVTLDELFLIFGQADHAFVLVREHETDNFTIAASRTSGPSEEALAPSGTVVDHVYKSRQAVLSTSAMDDPRFRAAQSIVGSFTTSVLCAPIVVGENVLGVIYVATRQGSAPFKEDDLQLILCVAATLAIFVENARLHADFIEADRLATIGRTVAGTAHCVKNILNGLQAGSYIIDRKLADDTPADVLRGWDIVKRNMQFLSNIVLDMLSYSKERKPLYQRCPVDELCREIAELLRSQAESKGVELVAESSDVGEASIDETAIRRCLMNLVGNAIDACEEGKGIVHIGARRSEADGFFAIRVRDNGCGIDADAVEKIFDPFYSSKGGKGTGLGLAVVKKIVQEHGGNLQLDSTPGEGTEFAIELPLQAPEVPGG